MFFYIEAYSKDGQEILGSLDGQGILLVKSYKRTNHYKRLVSLPKEMLSLGGRVVKYVIKDATSGTVLETINKE